MKKVISVLIPAFLLTFLISCNKGVVETAPATATISGDSLTVIYTGAFISGVHTTSGTVTLRKSTTGRKYLFFDNFQTDAGPDLRIYLAEDLGAVTYSEVSNQVFKGNSQVLIDAAVNTDKKKKVLIWCKSYSVLFGSAELK